MKMICLHIFKRNKKYRILIHPLLAKFFMFCNLQAFKQIPAVFSDTEKILHHAHHKGLSKSSGPGKQCHLIVRFFYKLIQDLRLIDK